MKHGRLSILAALVLCLNFLPGTARAAEISTALDFTNQDTDTLGDGYSWAADTHTLTLNNFTQTISGSNESETAILLPENAALVLEGESTITNNSFGGTCIKYAGTLTVQGTGVLNLNLSMPTEIENPNFPGTMQSTCGKGIYETKDDGSNALQLESGTLNITGNAQDSGVGGYVGISGAEVHLNGGTVNMVDVTYGVNAYYWWIKDRKISVTGGEFHYSKSSNCVGALAYAINSGSKKTTGGEVSITGGVVDISGCSEGMSVEFSPVSVTGGTLRIHDLVRETVDSATYAFLCGAGSATEPEPKISLTGGNIEISGCDYILSAVNLLGMDMLEVGEGIDLRGLVNVDKYGIYPENTSLGIAEVRVYGAYTLPESLSFRQGNSGFWDIGLAQGSTLTIPAGKVFDLSQLSKFGDTSYSDAYDLSGGEIINNGALYLPNEPVTTREIVCGLNVSGSGVIQVKDRQTGNLIATLHRVTYQDGGEVLKTGVSYLDGAVFPYTPEKEGYVLDGWYKEESFAIPWDFARDRADADITLYAKWIAAPVTGVTLNKTSMTLMVGSSERLTAAVVPVNAANKAVTWASSDSSVATVDENGNVTAVGSGSAVITVTTADGAQSATCDVAVKEPIILPNPPAGDNGEQLRLVMETGISHVPTGLQNIETLNTPEKLETAMRTEITQTGIPAGNTAVYDVTLLVSMDGGATWAPAGKDNFPKGGLTVTLPYPERTAGSYTFQVVHMFTTSDFGKTPGETERPAVTNTATGLQFTVTGLSPISVGWAAPATTPDTPSSGSNGGEGWSSNSYTITVEKSEHGEVTANRTNASSGSTVTLTVAPDSGYVLDVLTVTNSRGNEIKLTAQGGGKYTFTMPSRAVTVKATFAPLPDDTQSPCDGGADCPSRGFTDLGSVRTWYHESVDYVLRNGLMGGYGNGLFGVNDHLSRAQLAQILFNKEGRPAVNYLLQYDDVTEGVWYTEAVRWATSQGIIGGYGNGMFGPNDNITREQLVVMLWRYAGSPAATEKELHFTDADKASSYALDALRWAVENGILNGYGDGRLGPQGEATRAEVAQVLKNLQKSTA